MSVVEDVRTVVQDFLAPELRELKARVDALEKRMDDRFNQMADRFGQIDSRFGQVDSRFNQMEKNAQARHEQVMFAIQQLADYATLAQRVSRLESKEASH
jgi:tetrahydromethanopterin S-methyltransferase subunit G